VASAAASTAATITALGIGGRDIDQSDTQCHRQCGQSDDRQNGGPPFPSCSSSHPNLLQDIDFPAGHLIAAQAQVAPALWRQTATLWNDRKMCAD
jgi:hypothetical protein